MNGFRSPLKAVMGVLLYPLSFISSYIALFNFQSSVFKASPTARGPISAMMTGKKPGRASKPSVSHSSSRSWSRSRRNPSLSTTSAIAGGTCVQGRMSKLQVSHLHSICYEINNWKTQHIYGIFSISRDVFSWAVRSWGYLSLSPPPESLPEIVADYMEVKVSSNDNCY